MVYLKKSSNLIGWEHFGLYLRNKIFPQHRICAGTQQIFLIILFSLFFFKFKKPFFFPHCPKVWGKEDFFIKAGSVLHNLIRVSNTIQKSRKNLMIQFHENTDRQQDRRMDTTYFIHRIILATAGSPAITTAVDWHFKSQRYRVQCQSYQNYCITVSMQKISSIHKLIIKI